MVCSQGNFAYNLLYKLPLRYIFLALFSWLLSVDMGFKARLFRTFSWNLQGLWEIESADVTDYSDYNTPHRSHVFGLTEQNSTQQLRKQSDWKTLDLPWKLLPPVSSNRRTRRRVYVRRDVSCRRWPDDDYPVLSSSLTKLQLAQVSLLPFVERPRGPDAHHRREKHAPISRRERKRRGLNMGRKSDTADTWARKHRADFQRAIHLAREAVVFSSHARRFTCQFRTMTPGLLFVTRREPSVITSLRSLFPFHSYRCGRMYSPRIQIQVALLQLMDAFMSPRKCDLTSDIDSGANRSFR